jgi:hypothetical protein
VFETLVRLLERQPYISKVVNSWNVQHTHDLDGFRPIAMKAGREGKQLHLAKSYFMLFGIDYDLAKSWLFNIDPKRESSIVVSRSTHYHDRREIDWGILEQYKKDLVFIGTDEEYRKFVKNAKFYPTILKCQDALEIAQVIKGSKLFIGNQSLCFALAEAMKHPRVLEVYYGRDNCRPNSDNGHVYLNNDLIEEYLK